MGFELVILGTFICYLHFMIRSCIRDRNRDIEEEIFIRNHLIPRILYSPPIPISIVQRIDIEKIAPLYEHSFTEETMCSICFDDMREVKYIRKTQCGHTFCSACIQEWLQKKPICPLCMVDLHTNSTMV